MADDAWCAAFVQDKAPGEREPHAVTPATLAWIADPPADPIRQHVAEQVDRLAAEYRFFHWHIEFPHLFPEDGRGGFYCVVGNPPWEALQFTEKEFFALRAPDVAAATNAAARRREIKKLETTDPELHAEYVAGLRRSAAEVHLLRDSDRFPLTAHGKINTYSVFAETMRRCCNRRGGCGSSPPSTLPRAPAPDIPCRRPHDDP